MRRRRPYRHAGSRRRGYRIKTKRYSGSPYYKRQRRKKVFSVLGVFAACIALLATGFFAMRVVLRSIDDNAPPVSVSPTSPPAGEETAPPADETSEPVTEPPVKETALHAVAADISILNGGSALDDFLAMAAVQRYNGVVLDFKDADGYIRYPSALPRVTEAEALQAPVTELKESLQKLKEHNIQVIARIYCFKDHVSSANLVEAAVQYKNKGYHWLDASPNAGGRSWLNPYSPLAQSYLIDIVREVASLGVDQVMLDGVQKPEGFSLDAANYGPESETVTLSEALSSFVRQAESAVPDGITVSLAMKGTGALKGDADLYGDNPLDLGASLVSPDLCYSAFPDGITLGKQSYTPTASHAEEFVAAAAAELQSRSSLGQRKMVLMPFIQGSGSSLQAQIDALKAAGIENYIVVS